MRLLNVHTLDLKEFTSGKTPPYSILSHRWGDDEVSYKEFRKRLREESRQVIRKIIDFCNFVKARKYESIWVPGTHFSVHWVWIDSMFSASLSLSDILTRRGLHLIT